MATTKVSAIFGGVAKTIKFRATKSRVTCSVKGLPQIRIEPARGLAAQRKVSHAFDAWVDSTIRGVASERCVAYGSTPEKAYRRAVKQIWA